MTAGQSTKPSGRPGRAWALAASAGALVVAAFAYLYFYQWPSEEAARIEAVRRALGGTAALTVALTYPVAGEPSAFAPSCNLSCARGNVPAGKTYVQVGPGPNGFAAVDAPPADCALMSIRFADDGVGQVTAEPLPVYIAAGSLAVLEACNPGARLRQVDDGLIQVPTWYRSEHGIAVSVPRQLVEREAIFAVAVCARVREGRVLQYGRDPDFGWLIPEAAGLCRAG